MRIPMSRLDLRRAGGLLLPVLFLAALLAAFVPAGRAAAATSEVDGDKVVAAWRHDTPVYQEPGAGVLSDEDVQALTDQIQDDSTSTPIFIVAVPEAEASSGDEARALLTRLVQAYGHGGTFIALTPAAIWAGSTVIDGVGAMADRAMAQASGPNTPVDAATRLVDDVTAAAQGDADRSGSDSGGAGGGTVALVGLGVLVVIAVAGGFVAVASRRKVRRREAAEFAQVRDVAEEDVTLLGEDVAQLDLDVRQRDLDPAARGDYTRALDAYDRSKRALEDARRSADLRQVTEALEDGRYAMVCVRARLDEQPVPERRPPCFFNPQHGPSATDRRWAPQNGVARDIPVCAADADILDRGQEPAARQVLVDGVRRPYWEGGAAYAPWYGGYYGSYGVGGGLLTGMLLGSVLTGGLGGFGGGWGGYDGGADGGGDFGGGDFGGGDGDFGGGDFGGFGGGDFGGGDF